MCLQCDKEVEVVKQISVVTVILLILSLCTFGAFLPVLLIWDMYLLIFREKNEMYDLYGYRCPKGHFIAPNIY